MTEFSETKNEERVAGTDKERVDKVLAQYQDPLRIVLQMEQLHKSPGSAEKLAKTLLDSSELTNKHRYSYELIKKLNAADATADTFKVAFDTLHDRLRENEADLADKIIKRLQSELEARHFYSDISRFNKSDIGSAFWSDLVKTLETSQLQLEEGSLWKDKKPVFLTGDYLQTDRAKRVYNSFLKSRPELQKRIFLELLKSKGERNLHDFFTIEEFTELLKQLNDDTAEREDNFSMFDKILRKSRRLFTGISLGKVSSQALKVVANSLHTSKAGGKFYQSVEASSYHEKSSTPLLLDTYDSVVSFGDTFDKDTAVTPELVTASERAKFALRLLTSLSLVRAEVSSILIGVETDNRSDVFKFNKPSVVADKDVYRIQFKDMSKLANEILTLIEENIPFVLSKKDPAEVSIGLKQLINDLALLRDQVNLVRDKKSYLPDKSTEHYPASVDAATAQLNKLIETFDEVSQEFLQERQAEHQDVIQLLARSVRLQASEGKISLSDLTNILKESGVDIVGEDGELTGKQKSLGRPVSLENLLDDTQ